MEASKVPSDSDGAELTLFQRLDSTCGKEWRRYALYAFAALVVLGAIASLAAKENSQQPVWEVTGLVVDYIDLPGLRGLIPADTSRCPVADPCGVGEAQGCSVCPAVHMWNDGCLCRKNAKGHTAPAGEVVEADNAACPEGDRCGMGIAKGCTKCPDKTWIRTGCTCRQPPMSPKQFTHAVGDFFGSIFGLQPSVMRMRLQATAKVSNPADVGARAEAGIFNISYRGHFIGSAATLPTDVGPRSSAQVTADVKVDKVPATVGAMMLNEILNNRTQLPVQVTGSVLAVCGPFKVHCVVFCDLLTDVSALPKAKFTRKACTYTYTSLSL